MWLAELAVFGFRNLIEQSLGFDPRANLIFGPNGSGKTNLLEAVAVLALGRSFRTIQDDQLLGFTAPHFRIAGKARSSKDKEWFARVYFSPAERKHYFLDRREVPKRSLFAGWLPVSVFLLDDRRLVAGPPAQRRAFLDDAIGKVSRTYRFLLAEFRRLLAQRNALLRRDGSDAELRVWDKRLAELADEIRERRSGYWQNFTTHFERMSRRFLPADEIRLEYLPSVGSEEDYLAVLARSRETERHVGYTRSGPHRDDFRILLNSRSLRVFGSYGQHRLVALALALAEAETALAAGRRPIYLMDDVAAELDEDNTRLLFDLIRSKGQLFYASARPPQLKEDVSMSGRERSGRFETLGQALRRVMKRRLGKRLASYEAVKVWPRAAGPEIAARCVALGIKSGILYVAVPTNVWLTELSALKEKLIRNINEKLGHKVVKGIRFQIGVSKRKR